MHPYSTFILPVALLGAVLGIIANSYLGLAAPSLMLHLSLVVLTAVAVLFADRQAFAWMRGKVHTLSAKRVMLLHSIVSAGLAGIIFTGGTMVVAAGSSFYLENPTFLIKMAFVAALVLNAFVIEHLSSIALTRSFASLTSQERLSLLISGAVSASGWLGAITCGLLLTWG